MGQQSGAERGGEAEERAAAAAYVAELSAELAKIARRHNLAALSFILEMARLEAENLNRHGNDRR